MKSKKKIILWTVAAVLAAVLFAAWLARDWPRRQVQAALETELGADVRLGRLEIVGTAEFELHRLEIRSLPAAPLLEVLYIERLSISGSPGDILDGRFDALHVRTAEIHIATPDAPVTVAGDEESRSIEIGTLTLSGVTVTVAGGGKETSFTLEGRLDGIGGESSGSIAIEAESFLPAPLLAVAAGEENYRSLSERTGFDETLPCRNLEASLVLSDGGREARVTMHAGGALQWSDGGDLFLPFPDMEIVYREDEDGSGTLEGALQSAGVFSMRATAAVTKRFGSIHLEQAEVQIDDPGTLLSALGALPEGVIVDGRVNLDILSGPENTFTCFTRGTMADLSIPAGESYITARNIRLSLTGRSGPGFPPSTGTFEAQFELPSLTTGPGLPGVPEPLFPLIVDLRGEAGTDPHFHLKGAADLSTAAAGEVAVSGAVTSSDNSLAADLEWAWQGPPTERLFALLTGAGFDLSAVRNLSGSTSAHGTLRGDPSNPHLEATIGVTNLEAATEMEMPGAPVTVALSSGVLETELVRSPDGTVEAGTFSLSGKLEAGELPPRGFRIGTSAVYTPGGGKIVFGKSSLDLSGLAHLEGTGTLDLREENRLQARIALTEADPSALLSYLEPVTGAILPGYSFEGSPSGEFALTVGAGGRWSLQGAADIRGTRFGSDDGARVMEGLDSRWNVRAGAEQGDGDITLDADAEIDGFILLWGMVFADYSGISPRLELHATGTAVENGSDRRWSGQAAANFEEGVKLTAGIYLDPGKRAAITVEGKIDDLEAPFEKYVRAPLADSVEMLRKFKADGKVAGNLRILSSGDDRTIEGRIRLDRLDLEGVQGGVYVRGLDLDLPVGLRWSRNEDETVSLHGDRQRGRLRFERMALGDVGFTDTMTNLVVQADSVALEGGLSLPLLGGKMEFKKLTLADLLRPSRHLVTGLDLSGVELRELSAALDLVTVEGKLEGHFPRVRLTPTELEVDGGGEFELFGGNVLVGDISGKDVLSRFPRLRFSARFNDIDLALVTRTFDFGEMSGILEGSISDCELFGGVPVRFEAQMRTVPRKGVPQAINVKAINNIAILGTGGSVGIFDRGIHKFLDRYTYERLGVKMKLDHDVFLLRGTESRGERELFLKGKLPFRIDIVNMQPGKTVSFRAMTDRLKDLDFSTATTEPLESDPGGTQKDAK